ALRGRRIINQNILLSLLIIAVLLPLALFGLLVLAAVVLVHEIAEVIVILNGLRASRTRKVASCRRMMAPTRTDKGHGDAACITEPACVALALAAGPFGRRRARDPTPVGKRASSDESVKRAGGDLPGRVGVEHHGGDC